MTFPPFDLDTLATHGPDRLKLVVLSDLHIHHDETNYAGESNYVRNMATQDPRVNPVAALKRLLDEDPSIKADFLVCCGDITDRAHPGALEHGWEVLGDLASRLGAQTVLASAGNHDVDSRYGFANHDAKGAAMRLRPYFPVTDLALANAYWSRHYCIIRGANYRIVLLNSAAYHGEGQAFDEGDRKAASVTPEYLHGRISDDTLYSLGIELEKEHFDLNILVCHHHPTRIDAVPHDDYSAMQNGEALINFLAQPGRGRWLVIHGHRHVAAIQRPGGATVNAAPLTFCAGSFGKVLPNPWPSNNQFYSLDLLTAPQTVGQSLAGEFRSWSWTRGGTGWVRSGFTEELPGQGGFGYLGELSELASKVHDALIAAGTTLMTYAEVLAHVPPLRYLAPGDWPHFRQELASRMVRVAQDDEDGEITMRYRGSA